MSEMVIDFKNDKYFCEHHDGAYVSAKVVEKVTLSPMAREQIITAGNAAILDDLFGPGRKYKIRGGRRVRT